MRPGGVHGKQLEQQNGVTKVERKGQEQVQSKLKEPVQPRQTQKDREIEEEFQRLL
jgi:hypothetical protein